MCAHPLSSHSFVFLMLHAFELSVFITFRPYAKSQPVANILVYIYDLRIIAHCSFMANFYFPRDFDSTFNSVTYRWRQKHRNMPTYDIIHVDMIWLYDMPSIVLVTLCSFKYTKILVCTYSVLYKQYHTFDRVGSTVCRTTIVFLPEIAPWFCYWLSTIVIP